MHCKIHNNKKVTDVLIAREMRMPTNSPCNRYQNQSFAVEKIQLSICHQVSHRAQAIKYAPLTYLFLFCEFLRRTKVWLLCIATIFGEYFFSWKKKTQILSNYTSIKKNQTNEKDETDKEMKKQIMQSSSSESIDRQYPCQYQFTKMFFSECQQTYYSWFAFYCSVTVCSRLFFFDFSTSIPSVSLPPLWFWFEFYVLRSYNIEENNKRTNERASNKTQRAEIIFKFV